MQKTTICFERELTALLRQRKKRRLPTSGLVMASVLVPLFQYEGKCHVLLTKRSEDVEHHKGEISFPGGKFDPCDADYQTCALRETQEEIGVSSEDVKLLGELDDFYTVKTQFLVVPFVGVIPYPYTFKASQREIAEILKVPLEIFLDASRRSEFTWNVDGQDVEIVSYRWRNYNIWGATARILKHFADIYSQIDGVWYSETENANDTECG